MADAKQSEISHEQAEKLRQAAGVMTEAFFDMTGGTLPPGQAGVAFLDGFINRQRLRMDETQRANLANLAGAYLGEALIADFGGRWVNCAEFGLGVDICAGLIAYPFAKASKQFESGPEDSVLSFFDVVDKLMAENRGRCRGA